jgi:hypothetical protein
VLVSYKSIQSTRGRNDDVWVGIFVLENLGILLDGSSTVEDSGLYIGHIFAESSVFVLNLICKFTGVTHDKDGGLASDWFDLLERGEDEHGGLTKTRFSLAKDIGTEDSLRNANLLDCRINRADVRSMFLQVYNDMQEIATSVHLRGVKIHKTTSTPRKQYRSKGTTYTPIEAYTVDRSVVINFSDRRDRSDPGSLLASSLHVLYTHLDRNHIAFHDILAFACISSSYQLLRFAPCPKRHPRIDRNLLKEGPELILACEMDGRAARTRTMELGDESYD